MLEPNTEPSQVIVFCSRLSDPDAFLELVSGENMHPRTDFIFVNSPQWIENVVSVNQLPHLVIVYSARVHCFGASFIKRLKERHGKLVAVQYFTDQPDVVVPTDSCFDLIINGHNRAAKDQLIGAIKDFRSGRLTSNPDE